MKHRRISFDDICPPEPPALQLTCAICDKQYEQADHSHREGVVPMCWKCMTPSRVAEMGFSNSDWIQMYDRRVNSFARLLTWQSRQIAILIVMLEDECKKRRSMKLLSV